ncbi:hypothetical protein [Paenibacillus koleovorans]|uniref:hypothetical protein n=1 Tax=Paenibacillus koleovorans TaxID=121608 RepID=UPI000FDA27AD|nr:hypothetical protein [Paenibacillus koleovorans]
MDASFLWSCLAGNRVYGGGGDRRENEKDRQADLPGRFFLSGSETHRREQRIPVYKHQAIERPRRHILFYIPRTLSYYESINKEPFACSIAHWMQAAGAVG